MKCRRAGRGRSGFLRGEKRQQRSTRWCGVVPLQAHERTQGESDEAQIRRAHSGAGKAHFTRRAANEERFIKQNGKPQHQHKITLSSLQGVFLFTGHYMASRPRREGSESSEDAAAGEEQLKLHAFRFCANKLAYFDCFCCLRGFVLLMQPIFALDDDLFCHVSEGISWELRWLEAWVASTLCNIQ